MLCEQEGNSHLTIKHDEERSKKKGCHAPPSVPKRARLEQATQVDADVEDDEDEDEEVEEQQPSR